jgi:sialate O-acetylesterase
MKKIFCLLFCFLAIAVFGQLRLPNIIADNMVLQQKKTNKIWGWCNPKEKITVNFYHKTYKTISNDAGEWALYLPALPAGITSNLIVSTSSEKIICKNVALGEVWLCSGQSNMEWKMGGLQNVYADELNIANNNQIRFVVADRSISTTPKDNITIEKTWSTITPYSVGHCSAVAYWFAKKMQAKLQIPIGLVISNWGTTGAESWISQTGLKKFPNYLYNQKIEDTSTKQINKNTPSVLFNAMIAPLINLTIKGVIWYQGETNTDRPIEYKTLFPSLIKDWRNQWKSGDFPFLFVQLSSYGKIFESPCESNWSLVREAQSKALKLNNTAMAVTIDLGEPNNIHPFKKKEIGERLANCALEKVYRLVKNESSGPTLLKHTIQKNKIILQFNNASNGLVINGTKLTHIAIAANDKKFFWAEATIKHNRIIVQSKNVLNPVAVRYAWADCPISANLFNSNGLPASPFRTDNW